MTTTSMLEAKIASARNGISDYESKIKKSEEELENCIKLNKILGELSSNSFDIYSNLQSAGEELNHGIKIDGVGLGSEVLNRASNIKSLHSKTETAISNVKNRIDELQNNIVEYKNRIVKLNSDISYWQSEISRLNAKKRKIGNILSINKNK